MRQLLETRQIHLTKSLGQNFLHDGNQLRRIVQAADLKQADKVLEIGPGLGPLTELLVQQAGEVLAIEKDARLVEVLRQRLGAAEQSLKLRLLHGDGLDYLRRETRDWSEWKLVANLPYSVASPILVELAQAKPGPRRMVATLQFEVARRLMAKPGMPDYGLLTLLIQLDYKPESSFKIPASCFFPEPDVDSACVCLVRREVPPLPPEFKDAFIGIVRRSFSQRRKMMFKLLKEDWPEPVLAREFDCLRLSPRVRAEEVSLEQFAQLTQTLVRSPK